MNFLYFMIWSFLAFWDIKVSDALGIIVLRHYIISFSKSEFDFFIYYYYFSDYKPVNPNVVVKYF